MKTLFAGLKNNYENQKFFSRKKQSSSETPETPRKSRFFRRSSSENCVKESSHVIAKSKIHIVSLSCVLTPITVFEIFVFDFAITLFRTVS